MTNLHQKTTSTSFDLTTLLEVAEKLVSVFQDSERCTDSRHELSTFTGILLDTISRLLELFDIVWDRLRAEDGNNNDPLAFSRPRDPQNPIISLSSAGCGQNLPLITGYQTRANINKFVLDESEKTFLLQEVLRGLTRSMNTIVKSVHQQNSQTMVDGTRPGSANLEKIEDLCRRVLERTYSAIGRYQAKPSLIR